MSESSRWDDYGVSRTGDSVSPAVWEKYEALCQSLRELGGVVVAFSGGVDSTLLLWAAHEVLGDSAAAVTAAAEVFPRREGREAADFCQTNHIRQYFIEFHPLDVPGFGENPPNRCYLCKKALFGQILDLAAKLGLPAVAEGSNRSDMGDYRPGMGAVEELGVLSPLRAAGLDKEEIRALSRTLGLPAWDKPSYACLASRFVYGETITGEKLGVVEKGEQILLDRGFRQVRLRVHRNLARIEILPEQFSQFMEKETRQEIANSLRGLGFAYVSLDLDGYRTGSMNEPLD